MSTRVLADPHNEGHSAQVDSTREPQDKGSPGTCAYSTLHLQTKNTETPNKD